jgi:GT2 family glycosyltransferase
MGPIDRTRIVVLNHNGRDLLAECLPSVTAAAAASPVPCRVSVIDNESTDESVAYLEREWPDVDVIHEPNRGLASFNTVLARLDEPVVFLLNSDVKLDENAVAPLLAAIEDHPDALFAAPLCWDFDGTTYEGMRTRVRVRRGLVQGMSRVPGHETAAREADLTAAAGPVLAVDRRKFLALGGYDSLYAPGRIEDLDLGYRGWMSGWRGYYVPESVAYHRGFASFGPAFGATGNDRLALRNTILFAWKNLRGRRLASHVAWLPVRLAWAMATGRVDQLIAMVEAVRRLRPTLQSRRLERVARRVGVPQQEAFFHRFSW